jgi:uncharacterized repeat protein (TIGR02543 family)
MKRPITQKKNRLIFTGIMALFALFFITGCENPAQTNAPVQLEVPAQPNFPIQYTIIFNTYGGSAIMPVTQNENTQVAKPANPTKAGWNFAGWFDAETGGSAVAWPIILIRNITVHAQWTTETVVTHTVTFDYDDETSIKQSVDVCPWRNSKPANT